MVDFAFSKYKPFAEVTIVRERYPNTVSTHTGRWRTAIGYRCRRYPRPRSAENGQRASVDEHAELVHVGVTDQVEK